MNQDDGKQHTPATRPRRPGWLAETFAWVGGGVFALSLGFFLYSYLVVFGRVRAGGSVLQPALFDTALFSVFALHHSLLARARFKRWVVRRVGPALERSVYSWIASLLFVAVCAGWQPVPGVLYQLQAPWSWAGVAAQCAGIALTAFGSRAVDVLDLAGIRPVLDARAGIAARRQELVTSGAYRLVRHPIYFAWALLVFGTALMTGTRFVFAIVSTIYLAIAIPFEERALVDALGADYVRYRDRVRWRMIPYVY